MKQTIMSKSLQNVFFYLLLLAGLLISLKEQAKYLGADAIAFRKGRGKSTETSSALLDRIEWVSDYKNRINIMPQAYIISFGLSMIIGIAMINRVPSGKRFFYMMIIMFPLLLFGINFFVYHTDRFVPYYVKKNLEYVRKKLKLERRKDLETLKVCSDNVATHSDVNSLKTIT